MHKHSFVDLLMLVLLFAILIDKVGADVNKRAIAACSNQFLHDVGEPCGKVVAIRYSRDVSQQGRVTEYFKPVWQVEYDNGVVVAISESPRVVCGYFNRSITVKLTTAVTPAGSLLSKEEAMHRSSQVLLATKMGNELRLQNSLVVQNNEGRNAGENYWLVSYERVAGTIPYREQGLRITINAETGRLIGMSLNFTTPSAPDVKPRITKKQALKVALSHATSANLTVKQAELVYVTNDEDANLFNQPPATHLAWEIVMVSSAGKVTVAEINALTGVLLEQET